MATTTVENYLKQLFLEQQAAPQGPVPTGRLASAMGVVPGTATAMVKALAESNLVEYEPRGGVKLTRAGEQLALHVLRRHRLVELFLVKVLGLDWSEVHAEAEELEHAISDKVLDRIDALLGHPQVDPHGDPIPSRGGKVARPRLQSLADCAAGAMVRVARITDQDARFLQFVERAGLMPGATVAIQSREPAADSISLRPDGHATVTLATSSAGKILVEAAA